MCREKHILVFNSLPFLTVVRLFAEIRTKTHSAELEGQAKLKYYKVVNLLSLSLTKNAISDFEWLQKNSLTLRKWTCQNLFWLESIISLGFSPDFYYPLDLAVLKIFLEKEIIWISAIMGSSKARTFRGRLNQDEKAEDFDLGKNAFNSNICRIWQKKLIWL